MALTKISRGLLDTGVSDSSDATAITISSDENVGIGDATSPTKQLEIRNNNATTGAGGAELRLTRGDSSGAENDPIGTIDFYSTDADGAHVSSFIKGISRELYARKGALTFGVASSNSTDATETMRLNEDGFMELSKGVGLHATELRSKTTVGTSFTTVLDFTNLNTNECKGFYLVTAVRSGGSVGTHGIYLVGLASYLAVYLYDTIDSAGFTAQTSGGTFQIKVGSGSTTVHTTAIPIGITGID